MKIKNIQYSRNGSSESYIQILFSDGNSYRNMMAITFDDAHESPLEGTDSRLAIINLDYLGLQYEAVDFRFQLQKAIVLWNESWDILSGGYTIKFPFTVN